MEYIIAIILGVIEGLTEFLPISSTGHLILAGHLLNFTDERAKTFSVIIQLAAILAVVTIYFERFLKLIPTKSNNQKVGFAGINGIVLLLVTSLPAVVAGLILHDFIKEVLFSPQIVVIGLALGGLVLIFFERFLPASKTNNLDTLTRRQAFGIGLAQVLSIFPGISRSASTIVGGSFLGLDRRTAVEYSFFAAIPIMVGATSLDLIKSIDSLAVSDIPLFLIGMTASYITAILAIKFFINLVAKYSLALFGYYRLALALLVTLLMTL